MPENKLEREKWIEEVIAYNEKNYNQESKGYEETPEAYIIYFTRLATPIYSVETDEYYYGIEKIEYLKPENQAKSTIVDGVQYDTKFTFYYGASGSYIRIDHESSTKLEFIIDLSIRVASSINETVGNLLELMTHITRSAMNSQRAAEVTTYNQYFYYNKVCSVKPAGTTMWYPTCQIGKRYSHTKEVGSVYHISGYLNETTTYLHQWDGVTVPPPVPSQAIEPLTKNHFYDIDWMINKAIEMMHLGGYVDIYGVGMNVVQ